MVVGVCTLFLIIRHLNSLYCKISKSIRLEKQRDYNANFFTCTLPVEQQNVIVNIIEVYTDITAAINLWKKGLVYTFT